MSKDFAFVQELDELVGALFAAQNGLARLTSRDESKSLTPAVKERLLHETRQLKNITDSLRLLLAGIN